MSAFVDLPSGDRVSRAHIARVRIKDQGASHAVLVTLSSGETIDGGLYRDREQAQRAVDELTMPGTLFDDDLSPREHEQRVERWGVKAGLL